MSLSILFVDDEPDITDLFRQRFKRRADDLRATASVAKTADFDQLKRQLLQPVPGAAGR